MSGEFRFLHAMAVPDGSDEAAAPRLRVVEGGKERRRRPRRHRGEPFPLVSYLILAVIGVLFYFMWKAGEGDPGRVAREFGGKDNALIRDGQWWRFLTPVFLHGSLIHLLTNGLSLYWFGVQLEKFYGWRKFLLIFIISGIAGNLVSFWLTPAPSLGASGALFGLIGAGLVFPIRFRSLVPEKARSYILSQLLFITVVNLGLGFSIPHVDNMAHMGGLVGGGLVALFLIPDGLEPRSPSRISRALLSGAVTAALLLVGWSAWAQWRWATNYTMPPVLTFGSGRSNPWWSVQIPKRWRFDAARGLWRSPDGAILQITDSDLNPNLVKLIGLQMAQIAQLAGQRGATPLKARLIDGKEARHITVQKGARVQDILLILAEDRQVLIMLSHGPDDTEITARDFSAILGSIRFIRPPTAADRITRASSPVPTR